MARATNPFMATSSSHCSSSFGNIPESITSRRLISELDQLERSPIPNCHAFPSSDSILRWSVIFDGPKDTLYESGTFFVELNFRANYPFEPPKVQFMTKIYHCNINNQGEVCLGLKKNWKSIMGIQTILQGIISLFYTCDPHNNPLVPAIADQYLHRPEEYEKMARIWTQKYAT